MGVRAAVLHEYGKPLDIEEIDLAPTPPGHVRVQIAASGLCHSDLSVMQGKFPFPVPAVLGHEGAGVVLEVGDGVTRVAPGDQVVLNWNPGCGDCALCRLGETHLCVNAALWTFNSPYATLNGNPIFRGLGTAAFATETLTVEGAVVPIDKSVPLEIAALVGCAITTGVGSVLNTAKVPAGATVAVVGCGGVGLSVVMGAKYAGAERIIAIDLSAERRTLARTLGATDDVDGAESAVQAVLDLTDGVGVDYAFEVVGVPATMQVAWGITRRGGTTVAVGAGRADETTSFTMFDLFFQSRTLMGCVYGSADPDRDFPRFLGLWRDGQLPIDKLLTERITLEAINDGFDAMQAGEGARSVIINT
jgi:S-(hydroxymethyl)glutathione dehydrogenase/alcohol dehydrogenase